MGREGERKGGRKTTNGCIGEASPDNDGYQANQQNAENNANWYGPDQQLRTTVV